VIRKTLNTIPASAASEAVMSVVRTAAFRRVCSASMITATASANVVDSVAVMPSATSSLSRSIGGSRREKATGTTTSDSAGAAAMPRATAPSPDAIPTATASGNRKREIDSISTSPPYRPNCWWPASQPRAKYDAA